MIPTASQISKVSAVSLCFSMILGCEGQEAKADIAHPENREQKEGLHQKIDPFQPTIDRLVIGEKIPLKQLVTELENRKWKEIQPLILASIKKRSQEPNWTREAQKKALAGYSRVGLIFSKRRRQQSLNELRDAIQKALKEEQAKKRQ